MTISLVPTRLPGVACALVMAFATTVNAADARVTPALRAADGEAPATVMAAPPLKAGDVGSALLAARTVWRKTGLSAEGSASSSRFRSS